VYHSNEYIVETFYTMQLTPTLKIEPNLQFVTNPAFSSGHDHALVFQLQLALAW